MGKVGGLHYLWGGLFGTMFLSSSFLRVVESFESMNVARRNAPTTTQLYSHNNNYGSGFNDPNSRRTYNVKSNDWWKDSSQDQQPSSNQQQQQQQRRASYADHQNGLIRDISDLRSSQRQHPQQARQQRVNYNTGREAQPDTPWKRSSSFPQTRSSPRTAPYQQQQPTRPFASTSGYNTRRIPTYQSPDPNFPSSNSRFPTTSSNGSSNTASAPWERQRQNYDPPPRRATFDRPLERHHGMVRTSRRNNRRRFPNSNGLNSNDFMYYPNDDEYGSDSKLPQQDTTSDESASSTHHVLESEVLELKQQISNMTKERENLLESLLQVQDNINRAVRMAESSSAVAKKQKMAMAKQEQTMTTIVATNDTTSYPAATSPPSSFFFQNDNEWNNATGTITSSSSLNTEDQSDDQRRGENNDSSLDTLLNGITLTQETLEKVLQDGGLEKYGTAGEEFDPHYHTALFAIADPNGEPGSIADVITDGYRMKMATNKDTNLHGDSQPEYKVLRYAEVSVVKEE